MTQEIITFKFEMVFEWMIGEFFQNQISIQKGDVLFNSQLLDKEIDINDTKYNTYHWNAIGKQTKDHKQKQIIQERESVFINQNKKNIPDIVCERILENPKYDRPQKSPRAAYGSRDMLQAAHLRQAVLPASAAGAEHHFDKALVCARSRTG